MKEIKLNNSEKMATTVKLKQPEDNSLKNRNPNPDQEKTLEHKNSKTGLTQQETKDRYNAENAQIINPSEKVDEIIKNNDKFETINVIMRILCKELGIPEDSGSREISEALKGVAERYYKSMEEWRKLNKNGQKQDIRQ